MSREQLLMAILEEMRGLRHSIEQQTLLSAHASRSQEYGLLYTRFKHLLPPTNGVGGAPDVANLWTTMRGNDGWREHMSPDQLGLLLCRDERQLFTLNGVQRDVPSGLVEEVLSRLPRLEQCNVRGMRCPTNFAALQSVPAPFPLLRSIDLQETAVADVDLLFLVQFAPQLRWLNVSNCLNVTTTGIDAARQRNPSVVITPATRESKQLEDAQRQADELLLQFKSPESEAEYERLVHLYGKHIVGFERESMLDKQLLALWMSLGGTQGWHRQLRPAQLTLLLSRLTNVSESFLQGREEHHATSSKKTVTTVPNAEIVGFVSQVLSRLPRLLVLSIYDCHKWPVDWACMQEVHTPFNSLWHAHIRHTPYSVADLMDFSQRVPGLVDNGLHVELDRLPAGADECAVRKGCLNRVSF